MSLNNELITTVVKREVCVLYSEQDIKQEMFILILFLAKLVRY